MTKIDVKDIELSDYGEVNKEITYDLTKISPVNDDKEEELTCTLTELFSTAEPLDYLLMILGTCGGLVTGVSIPYFNVLFGDMLDALNTEPDSFSERIGEISLSFVIVAVINLFSGLFQVMCWSTTGERQSQKLREKYVQAVLSMEIGWFDTIGAGELSTKVADLAGKVQDGLGRKSGDLIQYISQFISSLVVGIYLCWELTVVLLCSFPLIAFAGFYMITAVTDAQNNALGQYAAAGGLATESLGSIRTVTALNAQRDIISKYRVFLFDAMQVGIVKGFKVGLGNGGLFCACFLTYALGFWYGGKLVADGIEDGCVPNTEGHGCVTGGTILAVFFSVLMGSMALGQIAPPLTSFTGAKSACAHMFKVINRKPLIDGFSEDGLKPKEKTKGKINLKDVQFAYPSRPDINICNGYNLSIEPGQLVALVGSSGCGKSTIINLLLRFYDPQSGSISIDGNVISDLNVRWLRSQIGYVGQEPVLFSGSIADNIAYGLNVEASLDDDSVKEKSLKDIRVRVIEAAKLSNAHDFISSFPQGYDTDVGSNGVAMSGGQKQRIAIARALVNQPSILLLDEATSALDAASERIVQQSIDSLQQSKSQTTIVIAHRLSTIRNADKIAVVNEGVIAELGTHDDLLKKNGLYADLVRLQMSGHEDDNHSEKQSDVEESVEVLRKKSISLADKEDDLKKDEEELSKDESSELWWKMWGLMLKHPYWMLTGIAGACIFGAIFPLWGMLLAQTQNMFYYTNPDRIRRRALELAFVYVALAITSIVSSTLQYWGVAQVGERVSMRLRSDMFESLMRREISYFDKEENAIGTLTTKLSDDSRIVCKASGEALAKQLQAFFTLTIGMIIGFTASWKIAAVVLATFPVNIAASALQMQAIAGQQYDTENGDENNHGALISSAFTQMRTVSAFSMQTKVSSKYTDMTNIICHERSKKSIVAGFGFGGSQMSLFLTYALLFWYGSSLIEKDQITFEQMMTGILSLMLGALGLGAALADVGDQKAGLLASKRIFKSVEEGKLSPIDGLMTSGVRPTERSRGKIELKNVNFAYPSRPDAVVCKNYNLTINPGEVVALVGPSGSGKSTIMNLLLRFYDPLNGTIELDGRDINSLNVRWLRSQIGYVGQEPVLFSGNVSNNIKKGRANFEDAPLLTMDEAMLVSDTKNYKSFSSAISTTNKDDIESGVIDDDLADILIATKSSYAHDFITSFPQGYDTDVGEGSIMVSGGQKQRIAIARALVKQPSILLLDEATSALDANSEKMVQQSIDSLQQSKSQTTIVIAHRLSTIRNADKIAVIDKGEVVELGTHDDLLKKNGLYSNLWSKQAGVEN
jgi:ATP-binding cassette subfamily B (MDR/TAP) protein 1